MKCKTLVIAGLLSSAPLLSAPTAILGSLADFSRGTGGQTAGSWGLPTEQVSSGGQTQRQTARPGSQGQSQWQGQGQGQGQGQTARPGSQGQGQSRWQGQGQGQGQTARPGSQGGGSSGGDVMARPRGRDGGGSGGDDGSGSGGQDALTGISGGQPPPGALPPPPPQDGRRAGGRSGSSGSGGQDALTGISGGQPPPGALPPPPPQDGRRAGGRSGSSGSGGQDALTGISGGQPPPGALPPPPPQDGRGPGGRSPRPNPQSDFPPLDEGDSQYDPTDMPDLNRRIPSSCAEAGSTCQQCVLSAEENIQFNRRYLHVAWSITKNHLDYAERMIRFGDAGSSFHGAMALSWQLGGKPQIEEAVADLRETYKRKYRDYMTNIRRSLDKLAACEQDNFATQNLYAQYANLYYDMLEARYREPD